MTKRALSLFLCLSALTSSCTIIDVDISSNGPTLDAVGLVHGYASTGVPARDSLLRIELLDGRSPGAIALVELWPLARIELGLVGINLGVLGLDAGVGVLFHDPIPPRYLEPHASEASEESDEGAGDESAEDDVEGEGAP